MAVVELYHNLCGGRKIRRVIASRGNFLRSLRSLQKSYFGEQNLFSLQFQYLITLANCNKESIKKSLAHYNFRAGAFLSSLVRSQNMFCAGHQVFLVGQAPQSSSNSTTGLGSVVSSQWGPVGPGCFRPF